MSSELLQNLAEANESIPDPRSKQGVTHPYHGMIALVLLGLISGMPYVAHIRRWAKKHWHTLRAPLIILVALLLFCPVFVELI